MHSTYVSLTLPRKGQLEPVRFLLELSMNPVRLKEYWANRM